MKLLTKKIKKDARKQHLVYQESELTDLKIVAKYFLGNWTWYMMTIDKDEDYCWGIVDGDYVEMGSFSLKELEQLKIGPFQLGVERDLYYKNENAKDCWNRLNGIA